jgi:hypothetical protein
VKGAHEIKHHGKYMKKHIPDPLIKHYRVGGELVDITSILTRIITQLLQMINDYDCESDSFDGESRKLIPHFTAVIKRCLCVINETEYVEDEDGSTSEEEH